MTTHRILQLSSLLDTASSKARICRTGSVNLDRISNTLGSAAQMRRAERFERIAAKCESRLAADGKNRAQLMWAIGMWRKAGKDPTYTDFAQASCERTAQSLELELKHGEPYCVCHLNPSRDCQSLIKNYIRAGSNA